MLCFLMGDSLSVPDLLFAFRELGTDVEGMHDVIEGGALGKGVDDLLCNILFGHEEIIPNMVGRRGLEPLTFCVSSRRSSQLS